MSTYSKSITMVTYNLTDSVIRTFISDFYTAIESVGMAASADTGQLNPSTVEVSALPTSTATETIYRIHYLNDSLHSSAPIYLKTYWTKSSATLTSAYLLLHLKVGLATDGSGGITGSSHTITRGSNLGSTSAVSASIFGSGGTGYAGCFYTNTAGSAYSFLLSRTTDAAGAATGSGYNLYWQGDSSVGVRRFRRVDTTLSSPIGPDYTFIPGGRTTSHDPSTDLNVYRHLVIDAGTSITSPHAVTVHSSEVASGSTFDAAPIAGTTDTFRRISMSGASANARTGSALAVRWE